MQNKNRIIGPSSVALFLILTVSALGARADELTVTFIGNMGFHITDGETTLLSDFPYRSGAYGYMAYEMENVPEIVDGLSLITHFHGDHFDRKVFETMDLAIAAPAGVLEGLTAEVKIPSGPDMSYKGIEIEAFETEHKFSPEHFSYLVTWHGKRLYFPGDTESPAHMLQMKDIDVMFISPWLIRTIERQDLTLDTKILVVYHQKIGEEFPPFQGVRRMKQGESFSVSLEEAAAAH